MLAYARAKLERAGPAHAQVRQGDIYDLPLADRRADAVVMHQVLHFLSDPQRAVREAARVLAPGGRLLIVDFAPHELEFLREQYAHERLGFAGAAGGAMAGRLRPRGDRDAASWRRRDEPATASSPCRCGWPARPHAAPRDGNRSNERKLERIA